MSKYSKLIGSFERTGDFPLEANYIFADEASLTEFYKDELNATTLHNGLIKTVLDDGDGNQALYWCYTDDEGNYAWEKLIDSTYQSQIDSIISNYDDLLDALNKEIQDRKDAVDAIYGTTNPLTIATEYNNISKIAEALATLSERMDDVEATIESYVTQEQLDDAIDEFKTSLLGDPEPTTEFQTLRGIEDFVRVLQSQMVNTDSSLQKEVDDIETGVGLEADGSYSADASTNYLTEATSIMNALRILDSVIYKVRQEAGLIDSVVYNAETETIKITFALSSGDTQEIDFSIYDIIREWEPINEDGSAITLKRSTVVDGIDQLTADVNISNDDTNLLENINGSLYVSNSSDNIMVNDVSLTDILTWNDIE